MSKAIHPKMLLVSITLAVFCCMTMGAPMETTPSGAQSSSIHQLQDDACANGPTPITTVAHMDPLFSFLESFTVRATDLRPVFLTHIENAVSVLISDIKSTTSSYGRSVSSAHIATMLIAWKSSLGITWKSLPIDSIEIHKDEIKSIAGNYFDLQLDLILCPAHEKFMREADNILGLYCCYGDTPLTVWEGIKLINDLLSTLERVEEALKQEVIEFLAISIPDVLNQAGEVVADVLLDEASTSKYDACYKHILKAIFPHTFEKNAQFWKTQVRAQLIEVIPFRIGQIRRSNDTHKVTAAAMVPLDKFFGLSICLQKLLYDC